MKPLKKQIRPRRECRARRRGALAGGLSALPPHRVPPGRQHGGGVRPRPASGCSRGSAAGGWGSSRVSELAGYPAWLAEQGLAPKSVTRHVASLKVFFRYLQLEGVLADNQAELLGSQKLWQRVPQVLSAEQVDRLIAAPRQADRHWLRDRALLELLYATGCRVSELSNLRAARRAPGRALLPCCRGKGDKQRIVPLGERAVAAVERYLAGRARPRWPARRIADAGVAAAVRPRRPAAPRADLGADQALRRARRVRRRRSARTRCGTASPRTCWPAAPTCGRCRKCSATRASRRRRSTRTSITRG